MKTLIGLGLPLLLVSILLGLAQLGGIGEGTAQPPEQGVQPQRRDLIEHYGNDCEIREQAPTRVYAPAAGEVRLLVGVGAAVSAGEALFEYRADELTEEHARTRARIAVLDDRLRLLRDLKLPAQQTHAETERAQAEEQVAIAEAQLAKARPLHARGELAQERFDALLRAHRQASRALEQLPALATVAREELMLAIREAEIEQRTLTHHLAGIERILDRPVPAPSDGRVHWIDPRFPEIGADDPGWTPVTQGEPILAVAGAALKAVVERVPDRVAAHLVIGAEISVEQDYRGVADTGRITVLAKPPESLFFRIEARLGESAGAWLIGGRALCRMRIGAVENALSLPYALVGLDEAGAYTDVLVGARERQRRRITTGLHAGRYVEILSGLQGSERVVEPE